MELLDKQKLLEYIQSLIDLYGGDVVLQVLMNKIRAGEFDATEEITKLQDERDAYKEVLVIAKAHIEAGRPEFALIDINDILSQYRDTTK